MKHATYKRALALLAGTTLATVGLVATAGSAQAATTFTVGYSGLCGDNADFETIGEAVAVAQTGDTIAVCAGTYQESVTITTPGLFSHNTVTTAQGLACQDETTGNKTGGTANTWQKNTGGSAASSPQAICSTNVVAD